jgi:hypothetical protein
MVRHMVDYGERSGVLRCIRIGSTTRRTKGVESVNVGKGSALVV